MKVLPGVLAVVFLAMCSVADAGIRRETIQFTKGSHHSIIKGRIKGYNSVDYLVKARAGQSLSVSFSPSNLSAYFNVLPPDTNEALFVGSTSGNHYEAGLPVDGTYTIQVYLMRNAARRNETSKYTLSVGISDSAVMPGSAFDKTLQLQGIQFRITGESEGSISTVRLAPSGLEIDNTPIVRTIEGTIAGAEVADLNADGSPEVYVYIRSAGSGSYGSLLAYSANRRKSLSEIYLPPITDDKTISVGYMGHDEFSVLEGVLGRRFPVYRDGDTNSNPSGGMRQLQYKLLPGEAGWALKVDQVVEF